MTSKLPDVRGSQKAASLSFFELHDLISRSEYFDVEFYRGKYKDVAKSGEDPVTHYLEKGAAEGRDPHPDFDTRYYLAQCAERGLRAENPLLHFILQGQHYGLKANRKSRSKPDDRRGKHVVDAIAQSGLFDRQFYNETYQLDFATDTEAIEHFVRAGADLGKRPNFYFDPAWYLGQYPEAVKADAQPLLHYLEHGDQEGVQPSPLFEPTWYRRTYKIPADVNSLAHYLTNRRSGRFSPVSDFDLIYYAERRQDVVGAGVDPFEYFLLAGHREGHSASPRHDVSYFAKRYVANAVSMQQMQGGLVGQIERIEAGDGFAVISGWVADAKDRKQARPPLVIRISGREFGPIQFERRQDLASAGIAGGYAAFKVAVPAAALQLGKMAEITLFDGSRQRLRVFCPGSSVSPFRPSGAIDEVGPSGVKGWVFDPAVSIQRSKAILRYDDEYDEAVTLRGIRNDVPVQNLIPVDSQQQGKVYGFREDIARVLERLRSRKTKKSVVRIKLISSGVVLWTHTVPLEGGQQTGALSAKAKAPVAPPASEPARGALPTPTVAPQTGAPRPAQKPRMLVVSWDMGHNPIGRAYLLADIARAHFDVKLIGPQFEQYGKSLWEPLRGQTALPIEIFPGGALEDFIATAVKVVERSRADVVYVSKPRLPSLLFGFLMQLRHGSALVLDIDDHELSFYEKDTPLTMTQALAIAKADPEGARMPYAEVWARLCEHLVKQAGAITVSNIALQKKFGGTMVRHARNEKTFYVTPERRAAIRREFGIGDGDIAVLFLGTARPHKGIYKVAEALDRINNSRLVFVIVGTITDARTKKQLAGYKNANIKYFDNQPWARLHEIVAMADIVPVLQVAESRIAEFQIPAKLTDAIALNVPVVATKVAPLADFEASGGITWVSTDADLEKIFRARLNSAAALHKTVQRARDLYLKEFTYSINAARIRSAAEQARKMTVSPELAADLAALFKHVHLAFPYKLKATRTGARTAGKDLVFFWKQNDTDLYGRRSDMMIKYLLQTGKIRKILQLDRAINLHEMNAVIDQGRFAPYHEGNLVYLNTTRRLLRMADSDTVIKRTFLYRDGSQPQSFLGQELPPREAYADFVREALAESGMDPQPMAWVCPVVFDFPALEKQIGFEKTVVDIIDDQRQWKAQEAYLRRVQQNYVDILNIGDVVLSNCDPVKEGFRDLRQDILVVPNGAETFAADRQWALPTDLAGLPHPIVGYVGNLRDRVDVKLIRQLAEQRPKWTIGTDRVSRWRSRRSCGSGSAQRALARRQALRTGAELHQAF